MTNQRATMTTPDTPTPDDAAVPTGNTYDKYGSKNPLVRKIMRENALGLVQRQLG